MPKTVSDDTRVCELQTSSGVVQVPYVLKRYKRMRSIKLSVVNEGGVLLKIPWRLPERVALAFLRNQGDWLIEVLNQMPQVPELSAYLNLSPFVSAAGKRLRLELLSGAVSTSWVYSIAQERLVIRCKSGEPFESELLKVLRQFSAEVIGERVAGLAEKIGVTFEKVTIRDQRSMWGSCTDKKTLSFNWRLILLPPELMDHVIFHELAHLTHMNHSAGFYELLSCYDGQSKRHDRLLNEVSPSIMVLGR
ncbi:MAG: M48 family metallopeptidase [Opitutales bacterium]|nr:M48 family metallopeptidase [Opitutales bacterium]